MAAALVLTVVIMLAELIGGLISGSLALLADAGHMLTDAMALALALGAMVVGSRPADDRRTYGYRRLEILAALANGVVLVFVSGSILFEAAKRWLSPQPIVTEIMSVVAAVGLVANLVGLVLLRPAHGSLNVRGAFLHILGDTLSSIGVLAGAAVIALTGWTRVDPLLSFMISIVIVWSSFTLLREVVEVLLEAAPRGIDTERVRRLMTSMAGVVSVHDLHVWSITTGLPALSAHVVVADHSQDCDHLRKALQEELKKSFAIDHATLQIEHDQLGGCGCCDAPDADAHP
ncbi:MAG: cation transporter [Deltaproteobacteria bacterium]|nr:cation transporter [Deltaproteobacteria bacterium]